MNIDRHQICRMCLSFFLLLTVAGIDTPARAQSGTGGFFERTFKDDSGEHKYVVFVPANYRSDKPTPAILFLHGAGERGKDNRLQMTAGLAPFIQPRLKTFPFIVVLPQCASTEARILEAWQEGSADSNRAMLALEDTIKHYNIDQKRIVLTGWSMGGYGTWSLAMAHPTKWSGVVPLAGGGDISKVAALKDVPVWAFHGALDKLVHPEEDRKMVDALNAAGGKATYTELPQTGHYLCEEVYGNESVIQWMLDPQKTPAVLGKGPLVKSVDPIKVPFVPAVEIPEAVAIRLGNDALSALSFAIPDAVPADMLSGRLNDMFDSTVAQGRSFGIRFSGLSYRGRLERVLARGTGKDRIAVQLGARDITLTIGGTSISGERHSAQAGPINIVIGNRYPVWLNVELEPTIKDRQIKLKLIKAGFQIPDDNWYVSAPAGVSTQGFGMTESAVVEGLTSGLYGAKGRIENEVLSVVPGMLAEVEKMLVLPDTGSPVSTSSSSISRLWPLPIYPPRMRIWPQQISTDEKGISLVVGITAASMDPYGPAKPLKVVESAGAKLDRLPRDSALHAMVAPQILTPLTEMAVEADQLKLDLLDIPDPLFTRMADRATLQEIIPDLKQYGDDLKVRSSLRIIRPLEAGDPSKPVADSDNKPFEFRVHGIQIAISIKTDAKPMWQPCAVFELDVTEQVKANLSAPAHDLRIVSLDWQQETGVAAKARFADGYTPRDSTLNTDQYVDLFKQAWKTFSKGTTAAKMEVPDLAIGRSRLRLDGLRWNSPLVEVTYHLARIKITNLSPEPFTYETKAPTSPWGQPLTLKPGDSHEFEIPYPLTYRRKTARGDYEVYTLTVGSHSEYRVPLAGGAPRLFEARKPPVEH